MPSNRAYFRAARAADKSAVFSFTRHTYAHGDYIRLVWKDWLQDVNGRLLVSTINRRPVAVAHIARLSPEEAWLEGMRVDPAFRRFGLATALTRYSLKQAVRLSAGSLGFLTADSNTAIHAMSAKLGFERVAAIQAYQAAPLADSSGEPEKAVPADLPALLEFTARSPLLAELGGLYGTGWHFLTLDRSQMEAHLRAGKVVVVRRAGVIEAAAILEKRGYDKNLVICYIDGSAPALNDLLTAIRGLAAGCKQAAVSARLPARHPVTARFESAGYSPTADENFWIYRKSLDNRPGSAI